MGNLDPLLAGIKRVALGSALLAVGTPPAIVLNFVTGTLTLNLTTGYYDYTPSGGLAQQTVSGGASITANTNSMVWVDASGGTCTIAAPTIAAGAQWGVVDGKKGSSFSATQYASITNAAGIIEDPGAPGVYTNNPILMQQPASWCVWTADPTGTFWKVTG